MILFLILNLLNYCLLIIPEKIEISSLSSFSDEDNENFQNCPCDLTFNTCDRNCECDERCKNIDGGNDNYDDYNEYKIPGNHVFEKKYQKLLPMCSDLDKSPITDLYSPLTIGYQILKKGLCLFNKDAVKYDDDLHYDESIDEIIKKLELDNDSDDSDSLNNEKLKEINDENIALYDNLNIIFPIMLPDGSCLRNNDYIKFLQDKKVICYDEINNFQIYNEYKNIFNDGEIFIYSIINNTYLTKEQEVKDGDIIKKILFEFYVNNTLNTIISKKLIFIIDNNEKIEEYGMVYEVKFYSIKYFDKKVTKSLSGNPGYIKGKPIITNFFVNRVFSGVDSNGYCVKKENNNGNIYYEDDIIENTFTFEDNIIYGCRIENDSDINSSNSNFVIYKNIFETQNFISLGNPYLTGNLSLYYQCNENNEIRHILSIDILYEAINAKNNTQNRLLKINCYNNYNNPECINCNGIIQEKKTYKYVKINSFKVESELEWWYAPGWKITFPKNIMYPFRIGTTSYEEK